ncbi:MAG TPA: hypothetical protein VE244_03575 [Nitrososphaeraceae archaeon]|jgi:hypothetical protein|nr:hypothetical protein [Nitrososphaeraceae archaeon]
MTTVSQQSITTTTTHQIKEHKKSTWPYKNDQKTLTSSIVGIDEHLEAAA